MFNCGCSCQSWLGGLVVSLDWTWLHIAWEDHVVYVIRDQSLFCTTRVLAAKRIIFYAKSLLHTSPCIPPFSLMAFFRSTHSALDLLVLHTGCVYVWIIAAAPRRAVRRLVKNPSRLQGHGSGFSTFVSVNAPSHTHTRSHTFQRL